MSHLTPVTRSIFDRFPPVVPSLLLLAAACGGAGTPPGAGAAPAPPPAAGPHTTVVTLIDAMRFAPEEATVAAGDTVVWINRGSLPHTTTDRPGTAGVAEHNILPEGAAPWDSGQLAPDQWYAVTFTVPGEYTYLCSIHEPMGMVGRVKVGSRE